jgi:hypothetical protein
MKNSLANKVTGADRPFHEWYRFVLSFPPHLVADYLAKFNLSPGAVILDPFCGTGTTLVEAKRHDIRTIGIEANPVAHLASQVKTTWAIEPHRLQIGAEAIAQRALDDPEYKNPQRLRSLPPASFDLLVKHSISPLPLHKALILLAKINENTEHESYRHWQLAFAKTLVKHCSNLHFGPEVGVRRNKREDALVVETWLEEVAIMAADLKLAPCPSAAATIYHADARDMAQLLQLQSIDAVFTSPPYPNEKDYTRATRLETVLLGLIQDKQDLRKLKQRLLRSNSRNIYKGDDDDQWIERHRSILDIAAQIENRRIELGKTSGFEKKYQRVTKLYFGGMARHLASLRPFLRPGAMLGYVVGDQASFLQVMIKTGQLLAEIATKLGYEVQSIDLFRTRLATATKQQMREEVVVLRWPGSMQL